MEGRVFGEWRSVLDHGFTSFLFWKFTVLDTRSPDGTGRVAGLHCVVRWMIGRNQYIPLNRL